MFVSGIPLKHHGLLGSTRERPSATEAELTPKPT
jgi:hypothetical protein